MGGGQGGHLVVQDEDRGSHGRDYGLELGLLSLCLGEFFDHRISGKVGGVLGGVDHVLIVHVRVWSDTVGVVEACLKVGA